MNNTTSTLRRWAARIFRELGLELLKAVATPKRRGGQESTR